jgi:hypothetical protein
MTLRANADSANQRPRERARRLQPRARAAVSAGVSLLSLQLGAVDEIRIYGRALNPAEVLRLYAGP